jgi:hypothetical protein
LRLVEVAFFHTTTGSFVFFVLIHNTTSQILTCSPRPGLERESGDEVAMKPVRCCFLAAGGRSPTPRQPYRACRGRAQHDRPPGVGLVRRLQAERIPHHSGTQYQHTATALRGLRATWVWRTSC